MDSNITSDLSTFADDTAIIAHGVSLTDVVSQITDDIGKLNEWFYYNKLTLNLDKTKLCIYFSKNINDENDPTQTNINGVNLEVVNSLSYLGVVIDNKLQFHEHMKNCIKRAGVTLKNYPVEK